MILLESPAKWSDYELIDSGSFEKLERFGAYYLIRPETKAIWDRSLSEREWLKLAHAKFTTKSGVGSSNKDDSGSWHKLRSMPNNWQISYKKQNFNFNFNLKLGLTSFKHIGVFPEQAPKWDYIFKHTSQIVTLNSREGREKPKVLNLFAYTGAASLAAKCAGADVTHLDSLKQVVTWARNNMELSGMKDVRWIVEDALKFVKREVKRGNSYQGIIMDPPAYGHGPSGERWKLDNLLNEFVLEVSSILDPKDSFLVLNLYSNGYSPLLSDTLVRANFGLKSGIAVKDIKTDSGELFIKDKFEKCLPLSVFTRFRR